MKIHFIGIGGIGMSALAKYYLSQGYLVSGSDLADSEIVEDLKRLGIKIFIGHHKTGNIQRDLNKIIYSAAVTKSNLELKEARRYKIKCQTYAQALGDLTKKYFTIAISGTHGKSTTTAMAALLMIEAGLDPTVIVGTKLREFGDSNFRAGKSPSALGTSYLLIEADEYSASFLNYWPEIIVVTNIEEDHLDFYKNFERILKAFEKFVGHLPSDGVLIVNEDDAGVAQLKSRLKKLKKKIIAYSLNQKESGRAKETLKVPGRHNIVNALAVLALARTLEIKDSLAWRALGKFHGTWRRFEYRGRLNGASIFDDYGHHPTEIKATLQGAYELMKSDLRNSVAVRQRQAQLWCAFQPHQYQRTYKLFDRFVDAFEAADETIILPVYSVAGREKASIKKKVDSEKLVSAINKKYPAKKVIYLDSFEKAADYFREYLREGDLAVVMGAGDIYKLTSLLIH